MCRKIERCVLKFFSKKVKFTTESVSGSSKKSVVKIRLGLGIT